MCTMVAICFSRQAIPGGRSSFGVKFFVVKWLMCVRCKCGAKDTTADVDCARVGRGTSRPLLDSLH